jgi:hypothetical protein
MAVTRARWLIGALIGAAGLIIASQSLVTYLAGRLVVGAVAVAVLIGVLAIGFASLARARRYIAREITALGAEPPSGALYQARRAALVALRQRGVSPDLDLLADATAAAEAERGYTGKYLVATTVLIGLVGTFGGLMETLGRAAPLLSGDLASSAGGPTGALALIAGPLAGLHVTFGTSVVAIVVTLALALVQGDVTLQHERLLALLQERTRHVLVPELWPADESTGERTVRALAELRASVLQSLTASATTSAEKIAAVVRVEVQRLVAQVRTETQAATASQTAALEQTSAGLGEALRRAAESGARELRDAATASRDTMAAAAEASREALVQATAASREAIVQATAASHEATVQAATASREAIVQATAASHEVVEQAATASQEAFATAARAAREEATAAIATLTATSARTAESIASSAQAAVTSLGELRGSLGLQLEGTSQALAAAAGDLSRAVATLSPTLAELAPQLGGLTAEIALLAARAGDPEPSNAVLDELVRLGEDVERLLEASQPPAASPEVSTRETGS